MIRKYNYDLETYPNFFLAVFKAVETNEWYVFEISNRKNDIIELYKFINQKDIVLIGFNNLNFDYPVLHNTILSKKRKWSSLEIYNEVERIIAAEYSAIAPWHVKIKQIDLYKIWHYDNKNKRTSLKWLEFAMRMINVEDLPYPVGSDLSNEQKDKTILYCKNDINATEAFYKLSEKHIKLREFYSKLEDMDLINTSEIKLSKEIFAKHLAHAMDMDVKDLKQMRTFRNSIPIKNIIFDYIKFNDPVNISALKEFQRRTWISPEIIDTKKSIIASNTSDKSIKFSVNYKNVKRIYAEGGLHSFGKSGIYECNDEYMIVDVDFASYYPHISFKNKLHPSHIPESVFNELYEGFYHERKKYPKSDPRNYVLKIILNGSYGLSKDIHSFLYDPKWQLAICINGQLLLTKLTELVYENCKKPVDIIFENTDGAMYYIHRSDQQGVRQACKLMEEISNIPLEIQECKKVITRDVNNYFNIITNDNIKFKGVFEIDRDYHKDHSKRIVAIALANYYINNIPVSDTITSHLFAGDYSFAKNYGIYDFCAGAKMKGDNKLFARTVNIHGLEDKPLSKMVRYYICNKGVQFIKKLPPLEKAYVPQIENHKLNVNGNQMSIMDFLGEQYTRLPKDRETNLEVGYFCKIFNKYEEKSERDYNINYSYYIRECNKIIKKL